MIFTADASIPLHHRVETYVSVSSFRLWRNLKCNYCTRAYSITYARIRIVHDKSQRVNHRNIVYYFYGVNVALEEKIAIKSNHIKRTIVSKFYSSLQCLLTAFINLIYIAFFNSGEKRSY
jgi:hypothetical protein